MPGFLEVVPKSWCYLFITSLPAEIRLQLFRTSRQLARLVVQCAPKVKLLLQRVPITDMETRRMVITSMLDEGRHFTLDLSVTCQQPYPIQLCGLITKLLVSSSRNRDVTDFSWSSFSNLQKLKLDVVDTDVMALCDAVQAGHMPHLSSISINEMGPRTPEVIQRMIRTVGPQVKRLFCQPLFWRHADLTQFSGLHSLKLTYCELTTAAVAALCQHPTLRKLSLEDIYADFPIERPELQPNWDELNLISTSTTFLAAFPLSGVQHVTLSFECRDRDTHALESVLELHPSKLVCKPCAMMHGSPPVFGLHGLCAAKVQLAKHLHPSCSTLILSGTVQNPDLIPALWAALPGSVHSVFFVNLSGTEWSSLWNGFPSCVEFAVFQFSTQLKEDAFGAHALEQLMATAPTHVRSVHKDGDVFT